MALSSDHLELSARLARAPAPSLARAAAGALRGTEGSSAREPIRPWPGVPQWRGYAVAAEHREASYSRNGRSASWAAHAMYFAREGEAREARPLQIDPDYLKQVIRRRSQDLATQALGSRSKREIVQSRGQAVERLGYRP